MNKPSNFDQYIEQSAAFAQPLLKSLRASVHKACPEVEEAFKWSAPTFMYQGKILCSMAAFKAHVVFRFWLGEQLSDPNNILEVIGKTSMGQLAKIKKLDDLPEEDVMVTYLKEAMQLIDQGATQKSAKATKKELNIPDYLLSALEKAPKAAETFHNFSYSNQKEYVEWLEDAKRESTREKRLQTTLEWLAEGKVRNWKYLKK